MEREEIFEYAKKVYGTAPEYLWKQYPDYAVLRTQNTKKWYAVIMKVPKEKLGMKDVGDVEIMNVKCEPEMVHVLIQAEGLFPGYHIRFIRIYEKRRKSVEGRADRMLLTVRGDITKIDTVTAIVKAANTSLLGGGGCLRNKYFGRIK